MAERKPVALLTVGAVLRKLRKDRQWSIRRLHEESGITRMTISSIERSQSNYHQATIAALAKSFGKTVSDIEAMVQEPPPPAPTYPDLSPEWVAFTRRVMRLSRLGQGTVQMMLLALEDAGAVRPGVEEPTEPSAFSPAQFAVRSS